MVVRRSLACRKPSAPLREQHVMHHNIDTYKRTAYPLTGIALGCKTVRSAGAPSVTQLLGAG